MKRIYVDQAVEKKPILGRLLGNLQEAAFKVSDTIGNDPAGTTLRQLRQLVDAVTTEAEKVRNRILMTEAQLQPRATRAKKR